MKQINVLYFIIVAVLIVAGVVVFLSEQRGRDASVPEPAETDTSAEPIAIDESPKVYMDGVPPDSPMAAVLSQSEPIADSGRTNDAAPRVQIVEEPDMKYPLLRVERGSKEGERAGPSLAVADHFVVVKHPHLSKEEFQQGLDDLGYVVHRKWLAPNRWLVTIDNHNADALIDLYDRALRDLAEWGMVEKDYVVGGEDGF